MKNLSDKELVVLAQSGNDKAFNIIMSKSRGILVGVMSKKFSKYSKSDIEDFIQDAMIKAYKNINKFNATHTFNTWFSRICVNTIIDHSRLVSSKMKNNSVSMEFKTGDKEGTEIKNLIPTNYLNPQERLEKQNKADLALQLLNSSNISDSIKVVAEMRYLEELSYDEISNKTDMPLGTVKAKLHRFKSATATSVARRIYEEAYK